jgi:UMF1 family MFS transporter
LRELARFRQALVMLVAFLIYNDGINTIIRMASIYGSQVGIASGHLIFALLLVQFVGIPFAFAFGWLADRIGAKVSVFIALAVYVVISVMGYFLDSALDFYLLAFLVGTVQGGSQALSRSMFASMIPKQRSSEFFAFFAVFEKFAGIIGPAIFAYTIGTTGSSQNAILSVIVFFVVGAALLAAVNVPEGQRIAREAERAA